MCRWAHKLQRNSERLHALGVPQANLQVTGNLKFDIEVAIEVSQAGRQFRENNLHDRPVWIAGSTHEGEEQSVLAAHQVVLKTFPDALLIIAPVIHNVFRRSLRYCAQQYFVCYPQ